MSCNANVINAFSARRSIVPQLLNQEAGAGFLRLPRGEFDPHAAHRHDSTYVISSR